jgi:hypothetical protein
MLTVRPASTSPNPSRAGRTFAVWCSDGDHAQNRADVTYDFTDGRLMIEGLPSHEDADRRLSNCRKIQQVGVLTH